MTSYISGIVRSIDIERDTIYLVTPIPLHIVKKVDVFLQGSIEIPYCLGAGNNMQIWLYFYQLNYHESTSASQQYRYCKSK